MFLVDCTDLLKTCDAFRGWASTYPRGDCAFNFSIVSMHELQNQLHVPLFASSIRAMRQFFGLVILNKIGGSKFGNYRRCATLLAVVPH